MNFMWSSREMLFSSKYTLSYEFRVNLNSCEIHMNSCELYKKITMYNTMYNSCETCLMWIMGGDLACVNICTALTLYDQGHSFLVPCCDTGSRFFCSLTYTQTHFVALKFHSRAISQERRIEISTSQYFTLWITPLKQFLHIQ